MSITYPRDMPPVGITRATFEPRYTQVRASSRGGNPGVAQLGPDLWSASYETVFVSEIDAAAWEAWFSSLRGGLRFFKAWHPLRRYTLSAPAGYGGMTRAAGGAFDGTGTLTAVNSTLDVVTLGGLPLNFALLPGDLFSFAHSTAVQRLHRVIEGGVANGAGAMTATVEPPLLPSPPANATVLFEKSWCKATVDRGSVSWEVGRKARVSFTATQVLV